MKIVIETIPHEKQRYETCGDWFYDTDGTLQIRVSDLKDWRKEALIGIHEAAEALLCRANKITQTDVDEFDTSYEQVREEYVTTSTPLVSWKNGIITKDSEPGDHPSAPYRHAHCFATSIERLLCAAFGLSWAEYEDAILDL